MKFNPIAAIRSFFRRRKLVEATIVATTPELMQQSMAELLLGDLLKERRAERRWKWFRRLSVSALGLVLFAMYLVFQAQQLGLRIMPQTEVVGIVRIHGAISSESDASANKVVPALKKAFEKTNVQSIILTIDSPGGQPAEAERIGEAITALKAKHNKPITAVITNTGASAAYMIALRTDKIVAGHYSLVGSIGAILQGWDVHRLMEKNAIGQRVYASGEHKNMLNPFTPMSDASNDRAQGLVDALGGRFVDEVRKYRAGKLPSPLKIGTGEVWTGSVALSQGLIDEIGTIESVMATATTEKTFDFGPRGDPGFFPLPRTVASWLHELQSSLTDLRIGER